MQNKGALLGNIAELMRSSRVSQPVIMLDLSKLGGELQYQRLEVAVGATGEKTTNPIPKGETWEIHGISVSSDGNDTFDNLWDYGYEGRKVLVKSQTAAATLYPSLSFPLEMRAGGYLSVNVAVHGTSTTIYVDLKVKKFRTI